jgi:hypothetical protein
MLNTLRPLLMAATSDQPAPTSDTSEQRAAIDLLRRDPEARDLYTQFMTTSAMLELEHARPLSLARVQGAGGNSKLEIRNSKQKTNLRPQFAEGESSSFGFRVSSFSIAAAIVLLVTGWFIFAPEPRTLNPEPSTVRIAMVTGAEDAVFGDSPEPMNLGAELTPGRFVLESGSVQLMYHHGAAVDLYGPCMYEVIGPDTGYLHHGSMHVLVPPRARGFTVRTPRCDVVDLGTEFNLRVGAVGPMSVAVTQGVVELRDLTGRVLRRISAGVAVGITPSTRSGVGALDLREYALGDVADAYTGEAAELVASYGRDFDPKQPAANWSYLWNAPVDFDGHIARRMNTGPITDPACYRPLIATERGYTADGDIDNTNASPARFLRLIPTGGHPGRGAQQGELAELIEPLAGAPGIVANNVDRYAIAAWTVDKPGFYSIRRSSLAQNQPTMGRGIHARVFTSRRPASPIVQGRVTTGEGNFDADLGYLQTGDVIYVGLGPDGHDGSDSFTWDFDIIRSQAWTGPIPHHLENVQ